MPKTRKHKWKYQVNIRKKILVLIVLGVFLFIGLGYSLIESNLGISGALSFLSPHVTLTLDANGGSVSTPTVNKIYGHTYEPLPTPTRNGYSFLGWNAFPDGYTRLDYIRSTGTQYIVTDVVPTDTIGAYIKLASMSINADTVYFGSKGSTDNRFWIGNNRNRYYYGWNVITYKHDITADTPYSVGMNFLNNRAYVYNDTTVDVEDIATLRENTYPMYIFAGNASGSANYKSSIKLYSLKISDGDQIIRDFVPCINDTTGKAGLYDVVNGVFYGNQNTSGNDFTVGNIVYITSNDIVTRDSITNLKALWEANSYTVSFNNNGGSGGQTADVTATYDSAMPAISTTAPTKSGYEFVGWYDSETGGTKYYNADGTSARTYNKASNATLYAHWENLLSVGKYFTLVPDEATATTNIAGFSGSAQTSDQTLWRIININDDDTIDAVSEYVSTTKFAVRGTDSYKNYVAGLQDIASKYAKTGYTVRTRMLGYNGQTLSISDTSAFDGTLNPVDNPSLSPPSTTSTPTITTGTGEEYSGGVLGDTLYVKDYQLVSNVYKSDTSTYGSNGMKAYDSLGTAANYFLVRRSYKYDNSDGSFAFDIYSMSTSDNFSRTPTRYYTTSTGWNDNGSSFGVRPIITLDSSVTASSSGSGTKTDPYILN